MIISSRLRVKRFNPLPSQKQGETTIPQSSSCAHTVSIRSPHKARGDTLSRPLARIPSCFNPLPSQKQGETAYRPDSPQTGMFQSAPLTKARGDRVQRTAAGVRFRVSIRSPHKSKGRRLPSIASSGGGCVSIRSPHKSKGRLAAGGGCGRAVEFQSAPLTKARGDRR